MSRTAVCKPSRVPEGAWESEEAAGGALSTSVGGPTPTFSRQGRDKQRYAADGARLVAGCIPVRFSGPPGRAEGVEVLMISSTAPGASGGRWVFPKGGWEDDETVESAALRETVEEAGVRGTILHPMVGVFSNGGRSLAHVFALEVEEELGQWPESHQRQRRWMSLQEASASCRHQWMREALLSWASSRGLDLLSDASARVVSSESPSP